MPLSLVVVPSAHQGDVARPHPTAGDGCAVRHPSLPTQQDPGNAPPHGVVALGNDSGGVGICGHIDFGAPLKYVFGTTCVRAGMQNLITLLNTSIPGQKLAGPKETFLLLSEGSSFEQTVECMETTLYLTILEVGKSLPPNPLPPLISNFRVSCSETVKNAIFKHVTFWIVRVFRSW